MQRIIFVVLILLLAFPNYVHSAVVPSYEGWETAEEVYVNKLVNHLIEAQEEFSTFYYEHELDLRIVRVKELGNKGLYANGIIQIGPKPYPGQSNEWFNGLVTHELAHAFTDFSRNGYWSLPTAFNEALAECAALYVVPNTLLEKNAPRSRMRSVRKNPYSFPTPYPYLGLAESTWQQSATHSCEGGECDSYPELAYMLYRLLFAVAQQSGRQLHEAYFDLTRALYDRWKLGGQEVLGYEDVANAVNQAFPAVLVDGLTPGAWLSLRRTFSKPKNSELYSLETVGTWWDGHRIWIGPFNPSLATFRARNSPGIRETFTIVVKNANGDLVFSEDVLLTPEDEMISVLLPELSEKGLYLVQALNSKGIPVASIFSMVIGDPKSLVKNRTFFVGNVNPDGTINPNPMSIIGDCTVDWLSSGLTKIHCAESAETIEVAGETFSLPPQVSLLLTNTTTRWPVLSVSQDRMLLTPEKKQAQVEVYNQNPVASDESFRAWVTHFGSLDQSWCSTTPDHGSGLSHVQIVAEPDSLPYTRECKVCFESKVGPSTACVDVTYDPFK